jgi:hypothetical protein
VSRHEIDVDQLARSVVAPVADEQERRVEVSLRPSTLAEFVGQRELVRHLEIVLGSAKPVIKPPTTCSSPDRPDSARRRSRALWRVKWALVFASLRDRCCRAPATSRRY